MEADLRKKGRRGEETMERERQVDPTLNEILGDPIVAALMRRDGITEDHVRQLMERVRRSLRLKQERLAA
jgi:hypothetical protein